MDEFCAMLNASYDSFVNNELIICAYCITGGHESQHKICKNIGFLLIFAGNELYKNMISSNFPQNVLILWKLAEFHMHTYSNDCVYTPKHGSWLDIAEIGLCIMTRECLERRIPSIEVLEQELAAWNNAYRSHQMPINWQFSLENARIKLKRLYPDIEKFRSARDELAASKFEKIESTEENTQVTSSFEKDVDE